MKKLKKLFLILFMLLGIIAYPKLAMASSGSLAISASNTAIVGNTVTVTITLSSSSALGSWEFDVNYDSSYLQLISSNAENNGTYFVGFVQNSSTKTKTYTLKFRALKSGSTNITIGSYDVYDYNTNSMSITGTNKKITLIESPTL